MHGLTTEQSIKIYGSFFVMSIFLFVGLGNEGFVHVLAQQQQSQDSPLLTETGINGTANSNDTRTFKITFDSLVVNDDHDPFSSGEWVMDAYVNNRVISLFPGSISVNDGDTVNFSEANSHTLTIPNNNSGFIRISTVGWENDIGFEPIPVFFTLLDTRIPLYLYFSLVQQATVPFVSGPNDPNGFVAIQYNKDANFGVGSHSVCSVQNFAATDPTNFWEGDCDYRINYTIEEVK